MKIIIFLLCNLIVIVPGGLAADTLKIEITRLNRIGNNNEKESDITISQKFYTSDDTLFREIRYDEVTGELSGYTFYFYRNRRPSSEEVYGADNKIIHILNCSYDKNGNCINIERIRPGTGKMIIEGRTIRRFIAGDRILREKQYKGKTASLTRKYKYDTQGILISVLSKYGAAADTNIVECIEKYSYDPSGKITEVMVTGVNTDNNSFSYTDSYIYDGNHQLTAVNRKEDSGKPGTSRSYSYYAAGTVKEFRLTEGSGKILLSLSYEYRTNVMNMGIQKSMIDGLVYPSRR